MATALNYNVCSRGVFSEEVQGARAPPRAVVSARYILCADWVWRTGRGVTCKYRVHTRYRRQGHKMLPSVPFACAVSAERKFESKGRASPVKLRFKHTGNGCPTLAITPQYCSRKDLRMSKIQNFSGGACPKTPLAGAQCAQSRLIQSSNTRLSNTKMLPTALHHETLFKGSLVKAVI